MVLWTSFRKEAYGGVLSDIPVLMPLPGTSEGGRVTTSELMSRDPAQALPLQAPPGLNDYVTYRPPTGGRCRAKSELQPSQVQLGSVSGALPGAKARE